MADLNVRPHQRPATLCGAIVAIAIAASMAADHARAEEAPGHAGQWYAEARVGAPFPRPLPVQVSNSAGATQSGEREHEFSLAYVGALMVGRYLTDRLHAEFETSHLRLTGGSARHTSGFAGNPAAGSTMSSRGDVRSFGAMANLLYDLPVAWHGVRLFAGAGLGAARVRLSDFGTAGSPFRITDTDTVYTLCLLAGAYYPLNEQLDMTVRYTGVIASATRFIDTAAGETVRVSDGGGFRHGISFGLRYRFGAIR